MSADNLHVSSDGKYIWAAGHPVTWRAVLYLEDPVNVSPSQVGEIIAYTF